MSWKKWIYDDGDACEDNDDDVNDDVDDDDDDDDDDEDENHATLLTIVMISNNTCHAFGNGGENSTHNIGIQTIILLGILTQQPHTRTSFQKTITMAQ